MMSPRLELDSDARAESPGTDEEAGIIELGDDNRGFILTIGDIVAIDLEAILAFVVDGPASPDIQRGIAIDPVEQAATGDRRPVIVRIELQAVENRVELRGAIPQRSHPVELTPGQFDHLAELGIQLPLLYQAHQSLKVIYG